MLQNLTFAITDKTVSSVESEPIIKNQHVKKNATAVLAVLREIAASGEK